MRPTRHSSAVNSTVVPALHRTRRTPLHCAALSQTSIHAHHCTVQYRRKHVHGRTHGRKEGRKEGFVDGRKNELPFVGPIHEFQNHGHHSIAPLLSPKLRSGSLTLKCALSRP